MTARVRERRDSLGYGLVVAGFCRASRVLCAKWLTRRARSSTIGPGAIVTTGITLVVRGGAEEEARR